MIRGTRFWIGASVATALACGAVAPAGAGTASSATPAPASYTVAADCEEHQAFVAGDEAAVAARLPKDYTAERDPSSGQPIVFARALHCDRTTHDGDTGPATLASYGIVIQSPDGRGCGSGSPGGGDNGDSLPICNWYVLSWVSDERRVVDWLERDTPGVPARHVPGLVFQPGEVDPALGGAPLHFEAPPPAPSPFTIDDVSRERPGEISVRVGYWVDTPQGTVKLAGSTDDLGSGDADGVVRAAAGSELAELMGAEERTLLPGYSGFAAVRFKHGTYRKQVIGPAPNSDSFEGSCAIQGNAAFTPPATNTPAPLVATYDATGTCTGTLNGAEVEDAPVHVHDAAPADGACTSARTTAPGEGTLSFDGGPTIGYTLDFNFTATEGTIEVYGNRSGTAPGTGSFATDRTPPDVVAMCAGDGAATAPLDLTFSTQTPLVSRRQESVTPPSPPGRLRLTASPRRVRAGERATFRLRVTAGGGAPVPGAVVRLAGRRIPTNARGRARIGATFNRPGRRIARASKPGFSSARATIRVHRRR